MTGLALQSGFWPVHVGLLFRLPLHITCADIQYEKQIQRRGSEGGRREERIENSEKNQVWRYCILPKISSPFFSSRHGPDWGFLNIICNAPRIYAPSSRWLCSSSPIIITLIWQSWSKFQCFYHRDKFDSSLQLLNFGSVWVMAFQCHACILCIVQAGSILSTGLCKPREHVKQRR